MQNIFPYHRPRASLDKGASVGKISTMRGIKTAKRQKIGLSGTSISGINTRIMRAIPLLAAMNTNHHKQHE